MMTIAPVAAVTVSGHVGRGRTTVADRVIDRIAEQAAIEDADVVSAKANARVTGQTTVVEIGLGLRYPTPVGATTERVRSHLMTRVQELSGLSVSRVDVAATELVTDVKPGRRVQ
jgi:uncharacterized alkaline shock family protein YloU